MKLAKGPYLYFPSLVVPRYQQIQERRTVVKPATLILLRSLVGMSSLPGKSHKPTKHGLSDTEPIILP